MSHAAAAARLRPARSVLANGLTILHQENAASSAVTISLTPSAAAFSAACTEKP